MFTVNCKSVTCYLRILALSQNSYSGISLSVILIKNGERAKVI